MIFQFPSSSSAKPPLTFPQIDSRRPVSSTPSPRPCVHLQVNILALELPLVQNPETLEEFQRTPVMYQDSSSPVVLSA